MAASVVSYPCSRAHDHEGFSSSQFPSPQILSFLLSLAQEPRGTAVKYRAAKASCENEHVKLIFFVIGNDSIFSAGSSYLALSVYEGHIGLVEAR